MRSLEKPQRRRAGPCARRHGVLELFRQSIPQRGVVPAAVIIPVDEGLDVGAQVIEVPIVVSVALLPLERLQKTLTAGVVIGVGQPTHARDHLVLF